jgi:mRNA interferase MazF
MLKQFKKWIIKKESIHNRNKVPSFKEKHIFWCGLGENIGNEENGKNTNFERPVLIIRKFNKNLFWGVPLTTKIKDNPFYIKITFRGKIQCAMITHIRVMDSKRLYNYFGELDKKDFEKVKQAVKNCI